MVSQVLQKADNQGAIQVWGVQYQSQYVFSHGNHSMKVQLHASAGDLNKMHLGDGNDKADKVNGDEEWEIDVVVAQDLEDDCASEGLVQGNSGLHEVGLA